MILELRMQSIEHSLTGGRDLLSRRHRELLNFHKFMCSEATRDVVCIEPLSSSHNIEMYDNFIRKLFVKPTNWEFHAMTNF